MKSSFGLLLFSLACLSACQKKEPETPYKPGYLEQMIPYKNGQQVTFLSNQGDTFKTTVNVSCKDCGFADTIKTWDYNLAMDNQKILVQMRINYDLPNRVKLTMFHPTDPVSYMLINMRTKNMVSEFDCNGMSDWTCNDTFTVNGRTYPNVLKMGSGNKPASYYSKEKGLIQSSSFDGVLYYLLE